MFTRSAIVTVAKVLLMVGLAQARQHRLARRANRSLSAKPCPVLHTEIFRLTCRANQVSNFACLTADEGRVAIVTNVAVRCGGREGLRKTNAALADGEVVWSWRPEVGAKLAERSAGDGDNKAWSPGRARISRKTIAQGRPVVRLVPVVLPHAFCCTRTMGAACTRSSLRPLAVRRVQDDAKLGRIAPRERVPIPSRCLKLASENTPRACPAAATPRSRPC